MSEQCTAEVVGMGGWNTYHCTRKAKVEVKTDRGDYPLCTQHLTKFKRYGLWVEKASGSNEFIKPEHVLLAEREAIFGAAGDSQEVGT